jgi:DNA-cytosine methyltransferase
MTLKFVSLFSGIGGFDLGFERVGMTCAAQVEWDKAASSVLARHWQDVPRYGDVRDVGRSNLPAADVLCGGFPCQDVSVAGKRAGLAGKRSGLWFEFLRIAQELAPRTIVIENVPGLLSSNGGRDFAAILHGLVECGYRVCWRVLDAQYFGVPQRRRRVFVVGSLGDGRSAEILFERESGAGHPEPRSASGQRPAAATGSGTPISRIAKTLTQNYGKQPDSSDSSTPGNFIIDQPTYAMQRSDEYAPASVASTLVARQFKSATDLVVGAPSVSGTLGAEHGRNRGLGQENETSLLVVAEAIDVRNSRSNGDISGTLQAKKSGGYSLNYQNPIAFMAGQGAKAGSIAASETTFPTLKGVGSGTNQTPTIAYEIDTLYNKGISHEQDTQDASKTETDTRTILSVLRQKIGKETLTAWWSGRLDELRQAKILQPTLHGERLRPASSKKRSELGDSPSSRTQTGSCGFVREMWITECVGRTSQEWGLDEQQTLELGTYLSQLSQPGTQQAQALRDLWQASEGLGILREALSAFQEIWRPVEGQSQPIQRNYGVRRLTPTEAERLQGFPDGWTEYSADGKPQSDSTRYRQLGNAVAVPVIEWLGRRIVEAYEHEPA